MIRNFLSKTFLSKKIRNFWPKIFWDQNFSIFARKNRKLLVPFFFDQKFSDFFRRKFFPTKKIGSHISIPNDPKIPKITLRTACDHYKIMNYKKCSVHIFRSQMIPRFQKSHLENHTMSFRMTFVFIFKKESFFPSI